MIPFLSRFGARVLDVLTGRKVNALLLEVRQMADEIDVVREILSAMGLDVAEAKARLAGVAADVTYLKAKIDAIPAGTVLTEADLAELRELAAGVNEVTSGLTELDGSTDSSTPDPEPSPEV